MKEIDVSLLNVRAFKYSYISDWRDRFNIHRVRVATVKRLISIPHTIGDVHQVCLMSKNGVPETSVYIEGSYFALRELFELWYDSLQLEFKVEFPEKWTQWKKSKYHPILLHHVSGVQVYREGRGRRSYFCAKNISIDPLYTYTRDNNERILSDIKMWAKNGNCPLRFCGLKTSVFSLASTIIDMLDKLEETVPF